MPSDATKFPYKDTPRIEEASKVAGQKTFKNAKPISSEWLTKKKPVNQQIDEFYHGKSRSMTEEQ
jgi:hypothetical protein